MAKVAKVKGRKKRKVWASAERYEAERLAKQARSTKQEAGRKTHEDIQDERAREELRKFYEDIRRKGADSGCREMTAYE